MKADDNHVSGDQCQEWRIAYRDGKSPYQLAVEHNHPRRDVLAHLIGECSHDVEISHISRGRTHNVNAAECRDIRDRYVAGETIETLQELTGRRWKTLVRHLTGHCSHGVAVEAPTVEKKEILEKDRISPEECAQFRRGVRDEASVMAFADTVDYDYQVVLAHVNGECTHDIDERPREPKARSRDISNSDCQAIREMYRSSSDIEFNEIAEEYNCSQGTVERHVTFRCSHPPVDALVTNIEAVQDILEPRAEAGEGLNPISSEEIVQLENTENPDRREPARDLPTPDPDRVKSTRSRVVRNTDLTHDIKRMYDYSCQICGESRRGLNGAPYAEAHHIRPLGRPHNGPDEPGNILVLCPNHHADFDYGRIIVDPETYRVTHTYESSVDGTELNIAGPHEPNDDHLTYHNKVIASE